MQTYRLQLKIRSPLVTPVQGDTLFGHLCWGIAYHEGETALTEFLSAFDGEPPLAISNGFPHDTLPMPILESYVPEEANLEKIKEMKRVKKQTVVPAKLFFSSSFRFSPESLSRQLPQKEKDKKRFKQSHHMHNTINRGTGMVEEGGLYTVSEIFLNSPRKEPKILDVYLTTRLSDSRIEELFKWALEFGYGADKSTGKGVLEIIELDPLPFPEEGERSMALGNFVPAPDEKLLNLRADLMTKFGKLGGHFVTSRNPFKKPILMYKAGSTFQTESQKPIVGTLLKNIHKDPEIRHHALAPVIRYREEVSQ